MLWKHSRFAVLAGGLLLAACGGGGSSSSNTPPSGGATVTEIVAVPGAWSGSYQFNGAASVNVTSGAVTTDGFGYFADNNGYVFVLDSLPSTSPFNVEITGFAPPGQTFANGFKTVNFLASGSYSYVATGINVQASFAENDNDGSLAGSFNLTTAAPYSGTASLAALQGQWSGFYIGRSGTSANLTINGATGSFTGSDGYGCTLSGSFTQAAPAENLYYVNLNSSGSGCPGALNGLAYEESSDTGGVFGSAAGTYLYVGVIGPGGGYSMELKM